MENKSKYTFAGLVAVAMLVFLMTGCASHKRGPRPPQAFFTCLESSTTAEELVECRKKVPDTGRPPFKLGAHVPEGKLMSCDGDGLCWAVCAHGTCGALALACPTDGVCESFCDSVDGVPDVCYCSC